MASFLIGIVVMFVTFYIALIYGSAALGLLGFSEGVLMVLACLYFAYAGGRLGAGVRIPISTVEKGREVSLFIDTDNRKRTPYMKIRYRLRSSTRYGRAMARWQTGSPISPGRHSYRMKIGAVDAGNYTVELERMRIYDLSGLFYWDLRVRKSADFQVLPEIGGLGVRITERTRNFFGDADVYDDFRPGDDGSGIFDVREFRAGDRLQRVHWKLSAKSDELVVREDVQPLACSTVLLLDGADCPAQMADAYLSVAASIIFSLMDGACAHYVAWYSGSRREMVRVRVDDEEGYYIAVCGYMRDVAGGEEPPEQAYRAKYRTERPLHMLVLDGMLALWQDGEKLAAIGAGEWKEQLSVLELVL